MKIRCGNCGTVYNINDSLITDKPRRVRCSKCNNTFTVRRASPAPPSQIPAQSEKQPESPVSPPSAKPPIAPAETESPPEVAASLKPSPQPKAPTPSTPSAGEKWQVKVGEEIYEDLELNTLKQWIREGRLQPMDEVSSSGGEWVIACDIPILMRYFRLKESIEASKAPARPSTKAAVEYCSTHPQEIAGWKCERCGKKFCSQCVQYQTFGMVKVAVCDQCKDRCIELKPPRMVKPFWTQIPQMLSYPFVKGGAAITIIGAIVAMLPYIGLIIYPYSLSILNASARGKDRMPDWPDFSDIWEDILLPALRLMIGSLYVFVPLGIYIYLKFKLIFDISDPSTFMKILLDPINLLFIIFAWVYLPMVTIIVAVFKRLMPALNPITVFRLINAIKKEYFIMLLLGLLFGLANGVISGIIGIFPFGSFFGKMINWYFLIVEMRLLGLMVYQVEEKLGWD